jgi:hypothetical protein
MDLSRDSTAFKVEDTTRFEPVDFVRMLAAWAEVKKSEFNPADTYLLNMWDELLSAIFKAKYKLENLA